MMTTKDESVRPGETRESQPVRNTEHETPRPEFYDNNHITFTGTQVVKAYRTIRKVSVSSTWVKPHRPGVWWNGVAFSIWN